jgi:hypothetical protein
MRRNQRITGEVSVFFCILRRFFTEIRFEWIGAGVV